MNWLSMTVGAVFLICLIVGFMRGAVKIIVSLAATLATLVIVYFATPYVADALETYTPLDDMIRSQVVSTMAEGASASFGGEEEKMDADSVRRVLGAAGVSEEKLKEYGITIEDIVNGEVTSQDLAELGISRDVLDGLTGEEGTPMEEIIAGADVPRDLQISAIEGADLPEIFKNLLMENNNSEMYRQLGAETFVQYAGDFLAGLALNVAAFLCTFILITILVRAIVFALDIVSNLPVLGALNRLAGGVIGLSGALIIVWTAFVVITLLYVTSFGKELYTMIETDNFLSVLYQYNPIMSLATMFR
ncbi:CvpA family protein [uncultured Merdimonas sp.]|uniref:CvpA family protein n=1 Tax=uncultured Merdimonas sp. TaxID=2023269 RepID=UPI003209800E